MSGVGAADGSVDIMVMVVAGSFIVRHGGQKGGGEGDGVGCGGIGGGSEGRFLSG